MIQSMDCSTSRSWSDCRFDCRSDRSIVCSITWLLARSLTWSLTWSLAWSLAWSLLRSLLRSLVRSLAWSLARSDRRWLASQDIMTFNHHVGRDSVDRSSESSDTAGSSHRSGCIRPLDDSTRDRIAAGEILQRPQNAVKEAIENSIDAGASSIDIIIKHGGLKLIQISDNGSGILRDDLDLVCRRFTTSKLRSFDDLRQINSFGFRGEALASISHVADVQIISKTKNENCAFKANFKNGNLINAPVPSAGKDGTQLKVWSNPTIDKTLARTSKAGQGRPIWFILVSESVALFVAVNDAVDDAINVAVDITIATAIASGSGSVHMPTVPGSVHMLTVCLF